MKKWSVGIVLLMISLTGSVVTSCSTEGDEVENETAQLTPEEKNMLIQMREEEKLARDVYDYLFDLYGQQVFDNISNSEQMHMDKVLTLLNKYGIPDPALPGAGEFSNQDLQNLYMQLTTDGDVSLSEALKVGATIEDLDIFDLEKFSTMTDKQDILDVFDNLTCGSRNHMRAFYRQLTNAGETYTPQYISQTEFDSIINSSNERCN